MHQNQAGSDSAHCGSSQSEPVLLDPDFSALTDLLVVFFLQPDWVPGFPQKQRDGGERVKPTSGETISRLCWAEAAAA